MSTSYSHVIFPPIRIKGCTDRESSRYALANVLLHQRGGRQWLAATDGRKLALVPCEGNSDGDELIPPGALPNKLPGRQQVYEASRENGKWVTNFGPPVPAADPGRFPKLDDIVPNVSADSYVALTIDAAHLDALVKAIHLPTEERIGVTLFVPLGKAQVEAAVCVEGSHGIGAIMPVSRGDDPFAAFNGTIDSYKRPVDQKQG